MAVFSVLLSLVSYLTVFLGLTVILLQPVAAFLGYRSYRAFARSNPDARAPQKLIAALPLGLAIGVFIWGMWLLNTQYNP